jgi:hypothetical protein
MNALSTIFNMPSEIADQTRASRPLIPICGVVLSGGSAHARIKLGKCKVIRVAGYDFHDSFRWKRSLDRCGLAFDFSECPNPVALYSYGPPNALRTGGSAGQWGSTTNSELYILYNNPSAYDRIMAKAGMGDRCLRSSSPVGINMVPSTFGVLPYDLAGQTSDDSGCGSAGAYAQEMLLAQVF